VSIRRIDGTALGTCQLSYARILPIRDTDQDVTSRDARDLRGSRLDSWDVLEHLGAQNAIEGIVGKVERRDVAAYRRHPLDHERRLLKVQCGHRSVLGCQSLRMVSIAGAYLENGLSCLRKKAEQIRKTDLLCLITPIGI
jgi:hypothetical protein